MSEESQNGQTSGLLSGRTPIIILSILVIISLVAVCGLGYTLLRSSQDETAEEVSGEPTPFPESGGQTSSTGGDPIVYGISDTSTVSVTLDFPVSLSVSGQQFPIQQVTINPDGTWSPPLPNDETAAWVYGSIINYILGIRNSDQNRNLMNALVPGAQMILRTESGSEIIFEFESMQEVAVNDQTVFQQLTPGITLALMGSGENQRLVARGRHLLTETTAGANETSGSVGLGETAQLSNLQVTATNVTYYPDDANAPPGFSFFVVDFQILNAGNTAVDVSQLQVTLVDEVGNRYALNPVASRLGENVPLTGGFLNAGDILMVSLGFQVPDGLISSSVTMIVERRDTGDQIRVNIPYSDSNAAQSTSISLQSAGVSDDLANIMLAGQINNTGQQAVIVTQENVTLRTPDGASYVLVSTNPPFPWTIPAGQTLQYSVTFQMPSNQDTAVFTILNQPFQLDNLR